MHSITFIICLSKFIEYTTARANCNTNYELWVIICQKSINYCECITLLGNIHNGGGCGGGGRELSIFSDQFSCESKSTLKNSLLKNTRWTITHILECLQFKSLTIWNVGADTEKLEFSYAISRNVQLYTYFEKQSESFFKS